jgi:hypothetical protein
MRDTKAHAPSPNDALVRLDQISDTGTWRQIASYAREIMDYRLLPQSLVKGLQTAVQRRDEDACQGWTNQIYYHLDALQS